MGKTRSAIALILMAAMLAVGPVASAEPQLASGQATQHSVNQSGVMGRISFTATSAGVAVTGTATGLQPSVGRYVTLVYDVGSVPGGPTACEPTKPMAGMFVGIWSVDASGHGTLIQVAHDVAPLGAFDTVSIRDTTINGGFGPTAVVACGQVAFKPAAP